MCRSISKVGRDPVHLTWYGRPRAHPQFAGLVVRSLRPVSNCCDDGVDVFLRCYWDVGVVLLWCCDVAMLLRWCWDGVEKLLRCCGDSDACYKHISAQRVLSSKSWQHLKVFTGGPHPSTNRALCRSISEVRRDPVHSTRYGLQREDSHIAGMLLWEWWDIADMLLWRCWCMFKMLLRCVEMCWDSINNKHFSLRVTSNAFLVF